MATRSNKMEKYLPSSDDFDVNAFPFYWVAKLNSRYSMEIEKSLSR